MTVAALRCLLEAGSLGPTAAAKASRGLQVLRLLCGHYDRPADTEVFLGFVPGRVELLGKHTDYAGGRSLLCALDRGFVVAASANHTGRVRVTEGVVEDLEEFPPLDFPLDPDLAPQAGEWGNYPMTAVRRVARNFPEILDGTGVDIAFSGDLPVGSGMSGSSALMIMIFAAVAEVTGLTRTQRFRDTIRSGVDLAMYLACVENGQSFGSLEGDRGVGTFGGSEDHTAILTCRQGVLSLYRFAPTVWQTEVAWPEDWVLGICYSGVRAEKTSGAMERYNHLSARARAVVEVGRDECGGAIPRTIADLLAAHPHEPGRVPGSLRQLLGDDARYPQEEWDLPGRMQQFAFEDEVCIPRAMHALLAGDGPGFGRIVQESHDASRRYLQNIAPEVDFLRREAVRLGAWGASGFGAGFGGSVYGVLPGALSESLISGWRAAYEDHYPAAAARASYFTARPCAGVQAWGRLGRGDPPRAGVPWVDEVF